MNRGSLMIPDWMRNSPHPFTNVLIANRGEIAVRIIKATREAGLRSIAIFSDADRYSLHVEIADDSFYLPGETLEETYLNLESIIKIAKDSGAEAIHPGYGFLSERPDFAEAVKDAGLIWIGPPSDAIAIMGNKISARKLMIDSDVPVIPGEELEITEDAEHLGILASAAAKIGYPLLLKASAGGGGKGMRTVIEPRSLRTEYEAAAREASTAFGDGTIYIEKLLKNSRHVEIQILSDNFGKTIHLNERDCSLQRRFQKIIEESPSPALTPEIRKKMGDAAIKAANSVGYVGAGTVEFLLTSNGLFYFLEMNTRLQVEHPVTELVTGIDLVQKQFEIASGLPIEVSQENISIQGHAIEARIYAEDPESGFLPSTGKIETWIPPDGPGIRVDSGIREKDEVSIDFDPMLAKLIVHGPDRKSAIRRLQTALSNFIVLGVRTNIGFMQDLISDQSFLIGDVDTDFIKNTETTNLEKPKIDDKIIALFASASDYIGINRNTSTTSKNSYNEYNDYYQDPFHILNRNFP